MRSILVVMDKALVMQVETSTWLVAAASQPRFLIHYVAAVNQRTHETLMMYRLDAWVLERRRRWTVGWHERLDDAIADARERIENPEPVTPLVGGGEEHGSCVPVSVQRERWAAGLDPRTGLPRGRPEDSST